MVIKPQHVHDNSTASHSPRLSQAHAVAGYRYMFVSNSDNLGATMDLKILSHVVSLVGLAKLVYC